jgi:hypothetical protein
MSKGCLYESNKARAEDRVDAFFSFLGVVVWSLRKVYRRHGNIRGVLRWSRQTSATSWLCTKAKLSLSKVGKRRQGRVSCHARTLRFLSTLLRLISDFIYLWHVLRQQREKNSCRQWKAVSPCHRRTPDAKKTGRLTAESQPYNRQPKVACVQECCWHIWP